MIVSSASKAPLHLCDPGPIAVTVSVSRSPVIVLPVVTIRVVPVRVIPKIRERGEERKTKRIDKDECFIVEMTEVKKPIIPIEVAIVQMVKAKCGVTLKPFI
jgi:hypothetical protein